MILNNWFFINTNIHIFIKLKYFITGLDSAHQDKHFTLCMCHGISWGARAIARQIFSKKCGAKNTPS
jgi:hypothetical protein